ncbi:glycoside/pentoside/hexuronide transporter [Parascardovia denticolens DSM 10105 = JCM 12538]|uniref:Glycoside/pentoside/hexuronide transporter n=1 Tax=Parascardovia denticolens DSM 10105 = JCM 12538 TaxID=864564 RepID=E6K2V4_PARDN|nr:glycoside-pentoside-hexuronide (GPH):cation symporter [Parascardovia denticolens]EFG32350.1 sugar (Glycoside-Pentoside-Hexuronide) transporter [Parascardovia denticolens F0305]EFT82658.1 glycoside/pentoside/hexuronide transporter [Parascardovia denticolens DSM 10105 = JCM 12538]BAR04848.1 galactoside transport protein [Parascardovia denticolens DSM 10105 = JCM 12538]
MQPSWKVNRKPAVHPDRQLSGQVLAQRTAYAFGNLGQSAFYQALSTYFIVFVTNVLFIHAPAAEAARYIGVITGLIVAIRIAEVFIDPLLGNLIDNTRTRFGRFRPWQFIGGLVSAILICLIYSGMAGLVNVNRQLFMVLFVIVFIVLDVFYSLRDISYWGMIPALSADSHERGVYTSLGTFTGSLGYNGITAIVVPVVAFFSYVFTGSRRESQEGWASFGLLVAVVGLVTAWVVAFCVKESDSDLRSSDAGHASPLAAFKALASNDQLLWVALSYLLYAVANVVTAGVLFYLFKFVLNMQSYFWVAGLVPVVTGLIVAPLFPVANKRIPRRYLFIAGMVMMIVAYLIFILAPKSLPLIVIALILFYLPQTAIQMTAILCLTDSIEYGQLKTGRRNEAVTLSARPMLDKIARAVSNGIVGMVAIAAGMVGSATAADMTAAHITVFKISAFCAPLVCIVLSLLVFVFAVKIDEKRHAAIVEELSAALAAQA